MSLKLTNIALSNLYQLNTQCGAFLVKVIVFRQFIQVSGPWQFSRNTSVRPSARRRERTNEPIWDIESITNGTLISELATVTRNKASNSESLDIISGKYCCL